MNTNQTGQEKTAKQKRPAPRRPADVPHKAKPGQKKVAPTKKTAHKSSGNARQGSKTAKVLGLMKRSSGVTLKEIMKATAWQPHTVRGFVSGTLRKKLGIRVDSYKRDDNERTYRISSK